MKVLRATLTERLRFAEQEGDQPPRIPIILGGDVNEKLIPEGVEIISPEGRRMDRTLFLQGLSARMQVNVELVQTGPLTGLLNLGTAQYYLRYPTAPQIPGWDESALPDQPTAPQQPAPAEEPAAEPAQEPAPATEQPPAPPAGAPQAGGLPSRMSNAVAQVSALRLAMRAGGDPEATQAVKNALSWLRQASGRIGVPEPPAQPSPSTRPGKKKHRSFRMTR